MKKDNIRYMRFEPGDKVRIFSYDIMGREYPGPLENRETLEVEIEKCDRIVTIEDIVFYMGFEAYKLKEIDYNWFDALIECSLEECKRRYFINSRFEILDL